jgi:hypothetical protein
MGGMIVGEAGKEKAYDPVFPLPVKKRLMTLMAST